MRILIYDAGTRHTPTSGYGVMSHQFGHYLETRGHEVDWDFRGDEKADIFLWMRPPHYVKYPRFKNKNLNVFFTMHELETFDGWKTDWPQLLNRCEAIIVPNEWNKQVFRKNGTKVPIYVVPLGVNPKDFVGEKTYEFSILSIFAALGSDGSRENWKETIRAYFELFSDNEYTNSVRLTLKSWNIKWEEYKLFLEKLIKSQGRDGEDYKVDEAQYSKYVTQRIKRADRQVTVTIPEEELQKEEVSDEKSLRESYRMQALLARIGEQMGFKIWLPKRDRSSVLQEWKSGGEVLLDVLPLNYDEITLKTIEQIDVLWLKKRSIVRAFEVEHTTAVYSGILRMADLLALQPNMDIKLHIIAPYMRKDKVFQELLRPVFSLLEKGPLSDFCTFISYDSLSELSQDKHLPHLSDSVLEEYVEEAE